MTQQERISSAQKWANELASRGAVDAPDVDDVATVAAMQIRDRAVIAQLLLQGPDSLLRYWDELQSAIGFDVEQTSGTPREPELSEPVLTPAERREARRAALIRWRDEADHKIPDEVLNRLAFIDASTATAVSATPNRVVRAHADEIAKVLRRATSGVPVSTQPPSPEGTPDRVPVQPSAPASASVPVRPSPPPQPAAFRKTAATSADREQEWLGDQTFAPFDWTRMGEENSVADVDFDLASDGVLLTWPQAAEEFEAWHAYRVISDDGKRPVVSPDDSEQLGATRTTRSRDTRALTSAARHYAIWVVSGPDEQAARDSQPRLHACGQVVTPVKDFTIRAESGSALGQWTTPAGAKGVRVLRVPAERVSSVRGYDPSYSTVAQVLDSGLRDNPPPGRYEYRVYTVVHGPGGADVLSQPAVATLEVAATIQTVDDLAVERDVDGSLILRWTPPTLGSVAIYRVERELPRSIIGQTVHRDALTRQLQVDASLPQPVERTADGRVVMTGVAMPAGWVTAVFVPVTFVDDAQQRVGTPATCILPQAPAEAKIVERVRTQVVTFAWPGFGDQHSSTGPEQLVRVYQLPAGTEAERVPTGAPLTEISQERYDEQGCVPLEKVLPPAGCTLALYGALYSGGQPVLSEPVVVHYPGLVRVEVRAEPVAAQPEAAPRTGRGLGGLLGRRTQAPAPVAVPMPKRLRVLSPDQELIGVTLRAVHNPVRVPLFAADGEQIFDEQVTLPRNQPFDVHYKAGHYPGFVRVFISGLPAGRPVAVMERNLSDLRIMG